MKVDLEQFEAAIKPGTTSLASVMSVNNEIGVIQPVDEIGKLCRSKKVFFHTDAAQAVGKIPMDVNKMNIDLMSISGHKIYGPKVKNSLSSSFFLAISLVSGGGSSLRKEKTKGEG